jgi:hypothetical protein
MQSTHNISQDDIYIEHEKGGQATYVEVVADW